MRLIQKLHRVNRTIHLFDEDKIVANFMGMYKLFDAKEIRAPDSPHPFPRGKAIELPGDFSHEGTRYKTGPFLEASFNTGLVVIKDGKLVFEQYRLGNSESTPYIIFEGGEKQAAASD